MWFPVRLVEPVLEHNWQKWNLMKLGKNKKFGGNMDSNLLGMMNRRAPLLVLNIGGPTGNF